MCTLILQLQEVAPFGVVLATNRDELRHRPASPPFLWPALGFVAPRDEQAHGTWLGLNRHGLYVAVTNRFGAERFAERESRGALVVEALQWPTPRALHQHLATLAPTRFNAFHLLYGDVREAFVTWSDGAALHQQALEPGLHVVTERSLGGDDHARTELIRASWPQPRPDGSPDVEAVQRLLASTRQDEPFGGVCVDVPAFDYGTRSSMVLSLAPTLEHSRWWWADDRPDRTPFVERPELLRGLVMARG